MQVIMQVWSCDWCATPHSLGELKAEGPNGIGTLCSDCGLAFQQRLDREKVAPAADVDAPADDKGLAMAEPAEQEPAADWYQAGAASDQEQSANAAVAQAVGGAVLSNALASRPWIGELLGRVKERASALGLKEAKSGPWGEFMSPPGGYIRPQLTTLRPTVLANVQAYTGNCALNLPTCPCALVRSFPEWNVHAGMSMRMPRWPCIVLGWWAHSRRNCRHVDGRRVVCGQRALPPLPALRGGRHLHGVPPRARRP